MTTATVVWDEAHAEELRVCLATYTRDLDYRIGHEWDAEVEGVNNPLWAGAQIPGVEEGSDRWRKMAAVRFWWQSYRLEAGLTVAEAAAQIGVATSTLSRWESGERTPDQSVRRQYEAWLEERRSEALDRYRDRIIDLVALRDGWPGRPEGVERAVLLEEFTRIGGWHDQWRRSGVLPNTRR